MFRALVVDNASGAIGARVQTLEQASLPAGDVLVEVAYSTINYKDGLVITGAGGLVKRYPHVPGIDFAGRVRESRHPDYRPGDAVVLTGWRVGEVQWGGLAELACVNGDWLVPLPKRLDARQAMAIGTAGFTAMLAVMALEAHDLTPKTGEILVTGAVGGVGSVAIAILAKLGYQVVASTGRAAAHDYLKKLGAASIVDRATFAEPPQRPLEGERWAGCIDAVGGNTLARVLAQLKYGQSAAAVGLAGGVKLEHTVIPFLLRGVNLLGIDSVMCPKSRRLAAWHRLESDLPIEKLEAMTSEAGLAEAPQIAERILKGEIQGRVVIDVHR